MVFEWDNNKNEINIKKHGVSFKEASSVFYDDDAIMFEDPDHSVDEERFIIIGMSRNTGILTVCHCYREDDEVDRIISARKDSRPETDFYIQFRGEL